MTDDKQADTAVKDQQRAQTQLALGAMLVRHRYAPASKRQPARRLTSGRL